MYIEESGKAFDESILGRAGQEIQNLQIAPGYIRTEKEALMVEKEQNSDSVHNDNNYTTYCNKIRIANDKDNNKTKFKTKIPLPITMVTKARRRLNLMSHENYQHFTRYDKHVWQSKEELTPTHMPRVK